MNWRVLLRTEASSWMLLVRPLVGLQKFLLPDALGAGRFARIGIPWPDLTAPFVRGVETLCGALIILGLFTRLSGEGAAAPLPNAHHTHRTYIQPRGTCAGPSRINCRTAGQGGRRRAPKGRCACRWRGLAR